MDRHSTDSHDNHSSHTHSEDGRDLLIVALLNIVGFSAELAGGLFFGSIALLSDAFHMLFDAIAYIVAFGAAFLAERFDDNWSWTYGLHRLEPLAAFVNGLLLLPLVGYILWESYQRFIMPTQIATGPTIAIAVGGLLINAVSVLVINDDGMSLNERGALYHLLGDAAGSIAVIVSVVAINITGVQILDPIVAILIAIFVTWSALKILAGSWTIFLHRSPFDTEDVRDEIVALDGVSRIQCVHVWEICSQITVATVQVETDIEDFDSADRLNDELHGVLDDRGVDHATVELRQQFSDHDIHLNSHNHAD